MCYPIILPNTTPVVGPETKSNKQSISIYGDDGVRRTFVVDKEKVDSYLVARNKKETLGVWTAISAFTSTLLGIVGCEGSGCFNLFKKMNWAKFGALGLGAATIALIPSWLSARKDCNNAEAEITGKRPVF